MCVLVVRAKRQITGMRRGRHAYGAWLDVICSCVYICICSYLYTQTYVQTHPRLDTYTHTHTGLLPTLRGCHNNEEPRFVTGTIPPYSDRLV